MSAHTPGPWAAFDDEIVAHRTDQHIADVPLCDGMNPTEWQANLQLIAAAPELLAALKAIQQSCPTDNDVTRDFNAAWGLLEAAIAKAESP